MSLTSYYNAGIFRKLVSHRLRGLEFKLSGVSSLDERKEQYVHYRLNKK